MQNMHTFSAKQQQQQQNIFLSIKQTGNILTSSYVYHVFVTRLFSATFKGHEDSFAVILATFRLHKCVCVCVCVCVFGLLFYV